MIELNNVNKYYTNEEESLHVLKDIHLSVKKGEMIAIMGPSGSGKSTLINLLGFIFQNFSLIESNTVYENVELPLLYNGISPFQTKEKVFSVLERVGLRGKEYKYPKQLSGGQQQRVAIARALINKPKFIIADEPTGALDTNTSEAIMQLFATLNKEDDVTLIMVTHNPEVVPYCHRLIKIRDGAIIEDKELVQ